MAFLLQFFAAGMLLLSALPMLAAAAETEYTFGTDGSGVSHKLAVNRYPALYTGDFGDCLGGQSLFNITKFDAAYYADNLTIALHIDGTSNIREESLMMHISVEAYGESRFNMTFDPCKLNIYSMCPLRASTPVTGWAIIPVGPQQIGGIPKVAFSIPDFEAYTRLQIFSNASQSEIGCFQAVMRNGNTFSHPDAVAPVLGVFTLLAMVASFATAAYGISIIHMRMHYAHSLSVLVVFETFQSIFFTGMLSVNWPSVCVAWWSNFAWSAGIIFGDSLINSIDSFAGVRGNASHVGGAGSVLVSTGGGLITQIYGRSMVKRTAETLASAVSHAYNATNPYDYTWSGGPVSPGMPMPGTWVGFPGTLSVLGIPAADAFTVGLVWLMVVFGLVIVAVVLLKFGMEAAAGLEWMQEDRMEYFRTHWKSYLTLALLRTGFIAFFMVMVLTMFQFATHGPAGPVAIAAILFLLFLSTVTGLVAHACRVRTRHGRWETKRDQIIFHRKTFLKVLPGIVATRSSTLRKLELEARPLLALPFLRIQHIGGDKGRESVHEDRAYIKRFGWLSARYRRTRWWFSAYYISYQFVRACFLGGGMRTPTAQVFGLLILEMLAFVVLVAINPFEGTRNTTIGVFLLSTSKIITTGLAIALLPAFQLGRIAATVVGVIIIVVQGLLVIALLVAIVLSVVSSWMSMTRNREDFKPDYLESFRVRYFENMEKKASNRLFACAKQVDTDVQGNGKEKELQRNDTPASGSQPPEKSVPPPGFSVVSVRRAPKIEDEIADVLPDLGPTSGTGPLDGAALPRMTRASRAYSVSIYGAPTPPRRVRRTTWSAKELAEWDASFERPDSALTLRRASIIDATGGHVADYSTASSAGPLMARSRSATPGLETPSGERSSTPSTSTTPTPEILVKSVEKSTAAQPSAGFQ